MSIGLASVTSDQALSHRSNGSFNWDADGHPVLSDADICGTKVRATSLLHVSTLPILPRVWYQSNLWSFLAGKAMLLAAGAHVVCETITGNRASFGKHISTNMMLLDAGTTHI